MILIVDFNSKKFQGLIIQMLTARKKRYKSTKLNKLKIKGI